MQLIDLVFVVKILKIKQLDYVLCIVQSHKIKQLDDVVFVVIQLLL
jgi:hypothetical protein